MPPDGAWLHSKCSQPQNLNWPTGQHRLPHFSAQANAYALDSGYTNAQDIIAPRLPPPTMDPSRLLNRLIPMPPQRAESVSESEFDIEDEGESERSCDRQPAKDGGWEHHPDTIGMGTPTFFPTKTKKNMSDNTGVPVPVEIKAIMVLKRKAAMTETCKILYRRNYFAVQASYYLNPLPDSSPDETLYLYRNGHEPEPIQNLYMCMRGVVEAEEGPGIDIVVFNAKRKPLHQGKDPPPIEPQRMKPHKESTKFFAKSTGDRQDNINVPMNHTFPRNQFRAATQNNDARRSDQQFYHILLELKAEVIIAGVPEFFTVASRMSEPPVVRGRCPLSFNKKDRHIRNPDRKGRKPPRDRGGNGSNGDTTTRSQKDRHAKGASRGSGNMTGRRSSSSWGSTRASSTSHLPSLTHRTESRNTDTSPVSPQSTSRSNGIVNSETLPCLDRKLFEHQDIIEFPAQMLPFVFTASNMS